MALAKFPSLGSKPAWKNFAKNTMPKRSNAPNFLAIFGKRRLGRTISVIFLLLVIIAWIHFGHGPSKHSSEQQRIRKMMKHAWSGYYKYAKGSDELMPISKKGYNWTRESLQFTAVDSMDTLLIMDLNEEFEQAKNLVLQYDFNLIDYPINHFETNIRVLGGLLSANEFAPDKRFVILAEDLGDRLLKAFETPTGLPMMYIDLANGTRAMGGSFLATVGTLQLEFQYLSDLTGNKKYQDKALYVYEQLHFMNKPIPGLFPQQIDSTELQFGPDVYGIAANTDSFYEYLLKMYISTGMEKFKTWYEIAANVLNINFRLWWKIS